MILFEIQIYIHVFYTTISSSFFGLTIVTLVSEGEPESEWQQNISRTEMESS